MPAQDVKARSAEAKVVLTKLAPPIYPQIARMAHISGDVGVDLEMKKDGTVEAATAVSGPVLLYRAALESARQSQFECRNCDGKTMPYHLLYTFQLKSAETGGEPTPDVTRTGNHIVVAVEPFVEVLAPAALVKRRTWKCLYLWRCGY
ncbi:MAG: energy transducer TonB [Candidatus Acidiferrales bacterium]